MAPDTHRFLTRSARRLPGPLRPLSVGGAHPRHRLSAQNAPKKFPRRTSAPRPATARPSLRYSWLAPRHSSITITTPIRPQPGRRFPTAAVRAPPSPNNTTTTPTPTSSPTAPTATRTTNTPPTTSPQTTRQRLSRTKKTRTTTPCWPPSWMPQTKRVCTRRISLARRASCLASRMSHRQPCRCGARRRREDVPCTYGPEAAWTLSRFRPQCVVATIDLPSTYRGLAQLYGVCSSLSCISLTSLFVPSCF